MSRQANGSQICVRGDPECAAEGAEDVSISTGLSTIRWLIFSEGSLSGTPWGLWRDTLVSILTPFEDFG